MLEQHCLVAMGGNVGAVADNFHKAVDQLQATDGVTIESVSSFHRSLPITAASDAASNGYLNAAILLQTTLLPLELLDALQQIENQLGRIREQHWGPRTIDLDLICYGQQIIDLPQLQVPHPACWYRRFVLDPVVEIAANFMHPIKKTTFAELRSPLLARPLLVGITSVEITAGISHDKATAEQQRLITESQQQFSTDSVRIISWNCAQQEISQQEISQQEISQQEISQQEISQQQTSEQPHLLLDISQAGPLSANDFIRTAIESALG